MTGTNNSQENNEVVNDPEPIIIPSSDDTTQQSNNPFNITKLRDNGQDEILKDTVTKEKLVSLIIELFVVFLEQIWYYKNVYPRSSFRRVKSFGLIVYQNRHPGVIEYLNKLQFQLYDLLFKGNLNRFIVELHSNNRKTLLQADDSLLEVFGLSIANSPILKHFSMHSSQSFNREDFKLELVIAEFQSLLNSIITTLSSTSSYRTGSTGSNVKCSLPGQETNSEHSTLSSSNHTSSPSSPPGFKIMISPAYNTENGVFLEMLSNEDWILERTSLRHDGKLEVSLDKMVHFKDVDLNFLQVKGFCVDLKDEHSQ